MSRSVLAGVIAGLLAITPSPVSAQDCIDYADYLHLVGYVDTPGQPVAVVVAGDRAYLADGSSGLQILDISNPAAPVIIGSIDTPDPAYDVAVSGSLAYITASHLLQIADISNPASPVIIGQVAMQGGATDVTVVGGLAFVGSALCYGVDDGCIANLEIVDISNPTAPVVVGNFGTSPFFVHDVAVIGPYALVATGWSDLWTSVGRFQILDISNPASPVFVSSVDTEGACFAVAVAGGYAYAASTKLQVIDISTPAAPTIIGDVTTGTASGMAVAGNRAYVANNFGLHVIDVSNPAAPAIIGMVGTSGLGVALAGDFAYVPHYDYPENLGLQVVDISTPVSPGIVGSAPMPDYAFGVAVTSTHAFVASNTGGLQIVDVSNPALPTIVGSLPVQNSARDVAVAGNYAYLTDDDEPSDGRLRIVDISDPAAPAEVGSVPVADRPFAVAVAGNYGYVANMEFSYTGGLQVVDISSPSSPAIVGSAPTPGMAVVDVAVNGDYAYIAGLTYPNLGKMTIVEVSSPAFPALAGSVDLPSWAWGVALSGNYAVVSTAESGLFVVDVSSPAVPIIVGSVHLPLGGKGVAIQGHYAYVGDTYVGIQVVDISDPTSPLLVGCGDTPDAPWGLAVAGNLVYIADGSGLQILPAQCQAPSAVEISSFDATPVPQGILLRWITSREIDHLGFHVQRATSADGDYARVTSALIQPPGPYRFLDTAVNPRISYFYRLEAVDRSGGYEIYGPIMATAVAGPVAVASNWLAQNHPNPFAAASTAIAFELAHQAHATLQVFDTAGRRVRLLVDEAQESGQHTAFWDGRNDRGEAVSSGIYFYRLDAGDFSETRSLVRLR